MLYTNRIEWLPKYSQISFSGVHKLDLSPSRYVYSKSSSLNRLIRSLLRYSESNSGSISSNKKKSYGFKYM